MSIPDPKLTPGQWAARALGVAFLVAIVVLMIIACTQADLTDPIGSFRDI